MASFLNPMALFFVGVPLTPFHTCVFHGSGFCIGEGKSGDLKSKRSHGVWYVEWFTHLVLKRRAEVVVKHFLMENWHDASWHWRHNPHPVPRTAASHPKLILHVLHEGLCGWMMVYYGHFACLRIGSIDGWIWIMSQPNKCFIIIHECIKMDTLNAYNGQVLLTNKQLHIL